MKGSSSERLAPRKRKRCSSQHYGSLRKEAEEQAIEAAREIMRANVAKAREGSLAHTKWLFSLVEQAIAGRAQEKNTSGDTLAARLLLALDDETERN